MPFTVEQLAARIRAAREAVGMTQDTVAEVLGLSRPAVSQIESGKRGVSSLELARLAGLFGRDVADFFDESFGSETDATVVLYRRHPELARDADLGQVLSQALAFGRAVASLERLLGFESRGAALPGYAGLATDRKWETIRQGERAAAAERRRLGLDSRPLPDQVDLLEMQGIRAAQVRMPDEVSGLTLVDSKVGVLIAVNGNHGFYRRRFSFAHEYAHVLFDRDRQATVSRAGDRDSLIEMRANSFAAAFLLPSAGVRWFMEYLAKGGGSRSRRLIFDGREGQPAEVRLPPGSQEVRIHDVAMLAHHFRASRTATLYRLRSLRLINQRQLTALLEQERRLGRETADALGLREPDDANLRRVCRTRLVALGIEALRRELISYRKLRELAAMVDIRAADLERLVRQAGIEVRPPVSPAAAADWDALKARTR